MSLTQKLLRQFGHYIGGNFLGLVLGFATFPILTRMLTQEDYGTLSLITASVAVALAIAKGGLSDAIIRFYPEYSSSPDRLRTFNSTLVGRGLALSAIVATIYTACCLFASRVFGIQRSFVGAFALMGAVVLLRPLNTIVLNYLRAAGRTLFYNSVILFIRVATAVVGVALLYASRGSLSWYLLGTVVAEVFALLILWTWYLRTYDAPLTGVSPALAWQLIAFGVPLLATELGYLLLQYTDRYLLAAFRGEAELGLYSVGYSLPSYLNDLILFSVSYSVVPAYTQLYATRGREETEAFLASAARYFVIAVVPMCVGYAAVSHDLIVALASDRYGNASQFSPLILAGVVFLGFNYLLYAGLYVNKKSKQILATMIASLGINVVVNIILIPRFGAYGAAAATLAACLSSSVLTAALSFRFLRIRLPWSTLFYYLFASALMWFAVDAIETRSHWLNLAAKIPVGVIVIAIAVAVRERDLRTWLVARMPRS
jgi:O-antigen/teichoic acid export membrane protein